TGFAILHEGKTIHQYDESWGEPPRYLIRINKLMDRLRWLKAIRFYRLAFRNQASSTNERTAIFTILPPLSTSSIKLPSDIHPELHVTAGSVGMVGVCNTYIFDFCLRLMVATDVSLFIINRVPFPAKLEKDRFLVHGALRLVCNHAKFETLWREQLGGRWLEA